MFDHISIGVDDLGGAKAFYDPALKKLGYRCLYEDKSSLGYGVDKVSFWVLATPASGSLNDFPGLHFCFSAPSRESVDAFHAAALKKGGKDNGAPGIRPDYGADYYAAFVVDPHGYRLEAYCAAAYRQLHSERRLWRHCAETS